MVLENSKLWQNKLAKPHCWMQRIVLQLAYRTTETMPEYSDNLEDKVILSAAVSYTGSSWKKQYSNYQGECLQENLNYNFLHHSAQRLSALKRSITNSTVFCFLVALAMVICVLPLYSHIDTGNPSQDLPDILGQYSLFLGSMKLFEWILSSQMVGWTSWDFSSH